jgi:hypothetical protein
VAAPHRRRRRVQPGEAQHRCPAGVQPQVNRTTGNSTSLRVCQIYGRASLIHDETYTVDSTTALLVCHVSFQLDTADIFIICILAYMAK